MNEFHSVQNHALGAFALYRFCDAYYVAKERVEGPILPYIMPLLPLVFNEDCTNEISQISRVTRSRFLTILSDNREIPVGLQERMISMSSQTLKSLNVAFSTNLLTYIPDTGQLIPCAKKSKLPEFYFVDNQKILKSSKTLGTWFATYPIEELCIALNIVF